MGQFSVEILGDTGSILSENQHLVKRLTSKADGKDPFAIIDKKDEAIAEIVQLRDLANKWVDNREYRPMFEAIMEAWQNMYAESKDIQQRCSGKTQEYLAWAQASSVPESLYPWEIVTRLMNSCKQSLSGYNHREKSAEELLPATEMIAKWSQQAAQHDPFEPIGPDVEALQQDMLRVQTQCGIRPEYGSGTTALRDAASEVYRDMMVGPREVYDKIPQEIRYYLNTFRRRSGWSDYDDFEHTMLGSFVMAQSAPEDFGDEVPLLQLASDDMMGWCWGDVGSISFGISPPELQQKNWQAAWGLFEGH